LQNQARHLTLPNKRGRRTATVAVANDHSKKHFSSNRHRQQAAEMPNPLAAGVKQQAAGGIQACRAGNICVAPYGDD